LLVQVEGGDGRVVNVAEEEIVDGSIIPVSVWRSKMVEGKKHTGSNP
jgi:hypothetical protein